MLDTNCHPELQLDVYQGDDPLVSLVSDGQVVWVIFVTDHNGLIPMMSLVTHLQKYLHTGHLRDYNDFLYFISCVCWRWQITMVSRNVKLFLN